MSEGALAAWRKIFASKPSTAVIGIDPAAANSQQTGYYHGLIGTAPTYVFVDERNNWQAVQIAPQGYEGVSGKPVDGPDPMQVAEAKVREGVERMARMRKGRDVDTAIAAIHRQHTFDGRPSHFIPESE